MNPSKNVHSSAHNKSIANQNMSMANSTQSSAMQNIIGQTIFNTVYTQNPNNQQSTRQSNQQQNPGLKSNMMASQQKQSVHNISNNNMLASNNSSHASVQQSQHNDLSVFKTVVTGTQVLQNSVDGNNQMNQNLNQNGTVMKNGKMLRNIDINAQSQSMEDSTMKPNQSNFPMPNNAQYNNFNNIKAQTIHVSKDKSIMSQAEKSKIGSTLNQRSNILPPGQSAVPSQNPAALQSQRASAMRSNMGSVNANNQSIKNSFPMPPNNSLTQTKNDMINSNNQSVKPLGSTLYIRDNKIVGTNQSALNNHPNNLMSNIPNVNPVQSALNQQHPNLPFQSQQMRSVHSIQQNSNLNQNLSVQNSLNPQQQQSIKQSQQNMMQSQLNKNQLNSMVQSNVHNSRQSQNPNIQSTQPQMQQSVHNSNMNNSVANKSLKNSSLKASRNKSPPLHIKSNDGKIHTSAVDSHGNPYTVDENQKSVKVSNRSNNENEKKNDVKEVNNVKGQGFKYHAHISKAGRNQNGETKTNQDTPLVHPSIGNIPGFNLFGVLDGHGPHGHYVSNFCKEYFIKIFDDYARKCINEGITTPEGIYTKLKNSNFTFLKESFRGADLQMAKQRQFDYDFSGTTCNLVFQFNKYIVCASVGDSRGILIYDNNNNTNQNIYFLSHDHKPDLPQELARIKSKGGRVDKLTDQYGNKVGPNRVFKGELTYPGLAMSRSLGDFQAKECGVVTEPEINEIKINHNFKYMVICSDGVWEFMQNEQVRDLGNMFYSKNQVGNFCSTLVQQAVNSWEKQDIIRDDITVVCVYF